jgi:hypothetical protein
MKFITLTVIAWLLIEWYIDWAGGPIASIILFVMVLAIGLVAKFLPKA